jgi:beta-lactamase class D
MRHGILALLLLPLAGPAESAPLPSALFAQPPASATAELRPDLAKHFEAHKAEGAFLLHDLKRGTYVRYNPERCRRGFLPASTFKIFNTMAALDSGAVKDEHEVLRWDGVDRGWTAWNQDQDMATAFQRSTVWFYQEMARRIGQEKMQKLVDREGYGNRDLSGGADQFWIKGGLRITPEEQAAFLARLYRRELGFSRRAMDMVYELMLLEKTPAYTLRGKTGWTSQDGHQIGWLVGFVEKGSDAYVYVTQLESPNPDYDMRTARLAITRAVLKDLGLLNPRPASAPGH